jgi:predicted aminopeptidase
VRALALLAALSSSCLYVEYIQQGAGGQIQLLTQGRPLDEVIRDPQTSLRTAMMLAEIPAIKQYGRSYGLDITSNYNKYVDLHRPATVWFVNSADPLSFAPRPYCFPIVGCFPGLGWFDEDEGLEFEQSLEKQGFDAQIRPASAYSTGGWFSDPVVSTMLSGGDGALPYLANTILHESVHATVLIPDEQFFNETYASYIADVLTNHWIEVRFGPGSPEELTHKLGEAFSLPRTARTLATYDALKALYASNKPRSVKLAEKAKIIDELVADQHLRKRPNNASLTEARLYNGGTEVLRKAHAACGDVRSLIDASKDLRREQFGKTLQEDLAPIGVWLAERCRQKQKRG